MTCVAAGDVQPVFGIIEVDQSRDRAQEGT